MGGMRERRRTRARGAFVAAAALLLAAAPSGDAAGQEGDPPRPLPELYVAAGVLTPLADLAPGGEDGGGLQLSSSAGLRVGGIWWLGPRFGVGASGSWVPVDVERLPSVGPDDEPVPGGQVADADLLTGTVEAVVALPSVGAEIDVRPYLVGGVGLRRLAVEGNPAEAPSATDLLASVGGGFRTDVSERWTLRIEARDQLSVYGSGDGDATQHDLALSVGLGVRF